MAAHPRSRSTTRTLEAISWALLITVMAGGGSLLMLLTGGGDLTDHEEQFFRAGHAHAGVLSAIGIIFANALGRTALTARAQVLAWLAYVAGVLLQSGGMFVHMLVGEPGERSAGTLMTMTGGIVLAASVLFLAWQVYATRHDLALRPASEAPGD